MKRVCNKPGKMIESASGTYSPRSSQCPFLPFARAALRSFSFFVVPALVRGGTIIFPPAGQRGWLAALSRDAAQLRKTAGIDLKKTRSGRFELRASAAANMAVLSWRGNGWAGPTKSITEKGKSGSDSSHGVRPAKAFTSNRVRHHAPRTFRDKISRGAGTKKFSTKPYLPESPFR